MLTLKDTHVIAYVEMAITMQQTKNVMMVTETTEMVVIMNAILKVAMDAMVILSIHIVTVIVAMVSSKLMKNAMMEMILKMMGMEISLIYFIGAIGVILKMESMLITSVQCQAKIVLIPVMTVKFKLGKNVMMEMLIIVMAAQNVN